MRTGMTMEPQFNPMQLEETLTPNYTKHAPVGGSFERMHFTYTSNLSISLSFVFDDLAIGGAGPNEPLGVAELARRFLFSMCLPTRQPADIIGGGPATAHFTWPGYYSIMGKITNVKAKVPMFWGNGRPRIWTADVTLEWAPEDRFFADDMMNYGTGGQ